MLYLIAGSKDYDKVGRHHCSNILACYTPDESNPTIISNK